MLVNLAVNFASHMSGLNWSPKQFFRIKVGPYLIRTAENIVDFNAVLAMDSEDFFQKDAFIKTPNTQNMARDLASDFIIIEDQRNCEIIAVYRILSSQLTHDFYSNSEFNLEKFLRSAGIKLELTCKYQRFDQHNSPFIAHMLWQGLAAYVKLSGASFLFGTCNIPNLDLNILSGIFRYFFELKILVDYFDVEPLAMNKFLDAEEVFSASIEASHDLSRNYIAPNLFEYIRAGAEIHGAPALNWSRSSLNVFTVLDCQQMMQQNSKSYLDY